MDSAIWDATVVNTCTATVPYDHDHNAPTSEWDSQPPLDIKWKFNVM